MGSTHPSPSPQRAAVARRLVLIVDRVGRGPHRRANRGKPARRAGSSRVRAPRRNADNHAPLSTFSPGSGRAGAEEAPRRSLQDPLSRCLRTGGSAHGRSAPTRQVAATPGGRSALLPAAAAAAPPRAQPRLLSGPLARAPHSQAPAGEGGGRGEEAERTGRRRERRESWAPWGAPVSNPSVVATRGGVPTAAAVRPRRVTSPRGAPGSSETFAEEAWRAQPNSTGG